MSYANSLLAAVETHHWQGSVRPDYNSARCYLWGARGTVISPMSIPDEFEISWETQEGKRYEFKVPVRSKVPSDIKGKTVLFVIMQDSVEGYVVTHLPNFQDKRERFY